MLGETNNCKIERVLWTADCCSGVCVKRRVQWPGARHKHLYNWLDVL